MTTLTHAPDKSEVKEAVVHQLHDSCQKQNGLPELVMLLVFLTGSLPKPASAKSCPFRQDWLYNLQGREAR